MTIHMQHGSSPQADLAQLGACINAARLHRYDDIDRARRQAQQGLELLQRLQAAGTPLEDQEAELLVLLASFDRQDGLIESAVVRSHAALMRVGNRPPSRVACDAWIGLAWACAQIGEFSRALRYALQGLRTARAVGATDREAHALDVLGCVYAIFGDAVEALRHLDEAARIARATADRRRLCSVLNNLAMTLLGKGDLAAALAAGRESLRIAHEDGLAVAELNVVDTVASVLTAMGELPEAETCLVPAVSRARQRQPNKALANLLGSLGAIRAASGDAAQAESLQRAALDIATQIGDPVLERQCHKRLADLFAEAGRWQEAHAAFRRYHELNESTAGAKAAKRLTIVRIADEVDTLHDAIDPTGPPAEGVTTVDALEALTARLRARNRELADARSAADAANEAKSRFLSNMSHELRTPLNGVLGMAQVLMRTRLDATQTGYCKAILQSGQALSTLVTDLLEYSRMAAGRMVVDTAEFEPTRVVDEVLGALRPAAAARGLHIDGRVDPMVPEALLGDGKRVRQVLQHLVDNAVKFTKQGGVDVHVSSLGRRDGDARTWVRFTVADTGIGMDPRAAAALLEPFVQGDESNARAYGGSGLGLAIGRHLVGAMGGTLNLHSEPGKGSSFWFEIPLHVQAGTQG